jgi:hypothetical protein
VNLCVEAMSVALFARRRLPPRRRGDYQTACDTGAMNVPTSV